MKGVAAADAHTLIPSDPMRKMQLASLPAPPHVTGRLRAVRFLFRPLGHLRS